MKRRVLSSIIALALCLNLFPVGAFAADAGTGDGLCPHHPAHTDACGYASPVSEQECTHSHDDGCYTEELNCLHEHTAECYPDSGDTDEPVLCAHICTQDSGCITRTLSCPHEHDDTCGYVAGNPGAPCMFVCSICPIENLIDKLPSRLSADNAEQVQAQIDEIYALYDALTDEEQRQVDLSPCVALLNQLDGMGSVILVNGSTSDIEEYKLPGNRNEKEPYVVIYPTILTTQGYTWTGTKSSAIQVTGSGELYIRGGGAIVSEKGAGVEVQLGGKLYLEDPISIKGTTYALDIASGAEVHLSAGTYSGDVAAIHVADGNYADLLGEGFAFFDGGNAIAPENLANVKTLSVGQCTNHSSKTYAHNSGETTHTWTCAYCGATGTELCTFSFVQDGDGTGTCADCNNSLSIVVNEDDLSDLVYDGTLQPEEVGVTVTLTDGSNQELVRDRDYGVKIESITNAGQATVTVTGITFNGTFVKTYTVKQDEPGIHWDSAAYTVDYDGSAVAAGELPNITITIKSDEDLHPLLKYQYQKDGDTGFTDGLPTNAGTYKVKAYLEASQNYTPAETETLLTLTINPINPIVNVPTATKPIYNRTAQELVTAGTLHPVALADGLKIEFATDQNGPWFAAIPTATDAGGYTVWYQVTGLTDNYIAPAPNPAQVADVAIQRKSITPVVTLSQYSYLYDGGYKEPTVTVKDDDRVTDLPDTEYTVEYVDNRNVSTDANPAKVVVSDSDPDSGNYTLETVEVKFKITSKTQDTLSITGKPATFTYGDQFTLGTSGGSGNGLVTWEIVPVAPDVNVATVDANSGQVTITGHGSVTVKATKSGKDPATNVVNYEDATAIWTFTAVQKPVTATVTADDKAYDGDTTATVHAVVEGGVLPGDEITITGLTGTFDNADAGAGKTVTVVTTGAAITGHNSEHYAVTYSATTVQATIRKAVAKITTAPVAATPTYNGTAQALIATGAVVNTTGVSVEYALSETGPYSTTYPTGTNAGTYTVWYRVQETDNYTGLAPASVDVTINKKPVSPTIELSGDGLQTDNSTTPPKYSYIYDGTAKEPVVTLKDGTDVIPAGEYTVAYSGNVNVGTATVTATAKDGGNYSFTPVTENFTINQKQAEVLTAPEAAGLPLTFNTFAQRLVTAGVASGGTMVYSTDGENGTYSEDIPTKTDAAEYTVHYKVRGDANHSDSAVGSVAVTIAPMTVKDPTIELYQDDGTTTLVSYTYDGTAKKPKVVVKNGSTVIADTEYNIVYSDNTDAGHGTVNITDRLGGNYTVTGSATFVINKADIVFNPAPTAATLTYNGTAQELLIPGTTTGGTVLYALNSATSTYSDAIPTGTNAGTYNVYYKVAADKNHNDLAVQGPVAVTIGRKPLTDITIELTPDRFQYDGTVHLPTVTVKDGDTVLPVSEYSWACNVSDPKGGGTYTITVSDKDGGNYDLSGVTANTATFEIGKAAQAELVIEGKPEQVYYGGSFQLATSGGSGTGAVSWSVEGPATVDTNGNVTITGVGQVTVTAEKAADTNFEAAQAQLTFTAAPKPVTASVTVNSKPYDGTTAATVASADITADLVTGDTVTIDPASITATFDTPHAGTGKTVTLDTSKVQVTGDDAAKYAISYPATVTADITQATTTITTDPAAIAPLTYNGQPQALVTAGQTNVGFLVYSLNGTNFSREIPTGTNAGTYTVYYKVDETTDYTGVAVNATPISVAIGPKSITPKIELSETSYKYDGTKKAPKVTLKDGDTVIHENQYTVTWAGTKSQTNADLLRIVDTYTATIKNVAGGNYTIDVTAAVEITPAEQAALHITGNPEHVYYGDTITTLGTTGGTGEGTVKWSITSNGNNATIEANTGKLTITGTGAVTVRVERSVPNYGTVGDNWNFTVEPKPVTAEVSIAPKTYDGITAIADTAITAQVKTADLVNGDTVTLSGLKGSYTDPNAGTGKTVTLDDTNATKADGNGKYIISYPATAKGDIKPKGVNVAVTLSDHDLKGNATDGYYYEYDGTEKKPTVKVTAKDGAVLVASDYSVSIIDNKNVGEATVTVTAKEGGNYKFDAAEVKFTIKSAAAVLISSPQAKDLTYEKGKEQELVTVGTATGGKVLYSETGAEGSYSENIPKKEAAGTYTVYYMVKGDANHDDTTPQQMTATIKPREFTPTITLSGDGLTETNGVYSYTYDGTAKAPTVTVKDGTDPIDTGEYSVSYRDNINAGTATVTVSDNNGGNYVVNGSVTFEITKAAPSVTAPTVKTDLQYSGELQDLVNAGVTSHGTVVYSVNGGNYSAAIPTASAVGTYTISWKVEGNANHSDTAPATLTVKIDKNTVNSPTITLSSEQFKYNGSQQKPTVTVYDKNSRVIPEYEYTVDIKGTNGNAGMVIVDTYTVTIAAVANSNYEFQGTLTREFKIVPADQETISITGTPAQVRYGDVIQLGVSGGTGDGTVTWKITGNTGTTLTQGGLLTVKDVNTPIIVTVTRSRGGNYTDVSATWEFTAGKKPVTAVLTGVDRDYIAGDKSATVKAKVEASDLVFGDTFSIPDLTGTFDNENVGTNKTITITGSAPTITDPKAANYEITYPATATASILAAAATVDREPAANTLTYDASQSQALVTAGTATGGTMVYSLDGKEFTPAIPKGKDAGTYTVYYKAQGDGNHTDSEAKTVDVTIAQQTIAATALQIELSPPSGQYNGTIQRPAVTVRDTANNVIPTSEYKVTYVTDGGKNWKDQGTYTVKVEDITGGNYVIATATKDFIISTSAQAPLEIVNKPGQVYYGDSFTLSATGGSSSETVTWSSSDTSIADIDANGLVTIKGTGSATITATKAGGGNYDTATAAYPLNALQKPVTATVTADDKVYDGNTNATIHVTWSGLVGNDTIDTKNLVGTFDNENVGTNKKVTITGDPVDDATAQKYDITVQRTTTASITKATATAPTLTANNRVYDGTAQALVTGGTNTLYSTSKGGVYSATVPTGTNAGTYAVWYKEKGDDNHNDSEPQAIEVTITRKPLTADTANVTLSGNDLQTDANGTYYYQYDGADKTPTVTITDGTAEVPASEYTVTYSDNKNVTTAGKMATVTITDKEGGNYAVSGSVTFEIRKGGAQLTKSPEARGLTYTGAAQELVIVGTATGGRIQYKLTSVPAGEPTPSSDFSTSIPTGTNAGTYTVNYKVVGDDNHNDGPTGSVTVTIQPKTVISPKITVTGTYIYDGNPKIPADGAVKVEDGDTTIDAGEYTLSYQNNVNAGTATVIVTDNNGGNYTVNGTATFKIGKAAATVGTAPTGKTGLKYNGTAQELLDTLGTATGGTLVYSLTQDSGYSAAVPTGKAVGEYEIWYKVLGDSNHSDTTPVALSPKVEIVKNTVTTPTIQVTPASVKYTGEKQTPTVTVKDDKGLLIDGSEYEVTYADTANGNNSDLIQVGTYTVTIAGITGGNYTFDTTDGKNTAEFKILPADQTPLTITGTRERVYYGDTIQLGVTGGVSGGTVTWDVGGSTIASIDTNGLLKITGVGSVTVTATSKKDGYADQTATWKLYAEKKQVTAIVTVASKDYDGDTAATVTATLQASDFVGTDSFTITLTGCTFEDANAGGDKKVNVVSTNPSFTASTNPGSTDNHENYAITYPDTTTASIFKVAVTDVTAPEGKIGLTYTGSPQALVTAGSSTEGILEYSLDGLTYSASLPAGTNAGKYDVWYRVKGDGNHKDTAGEKLDNPVNIAPQEVAAPIIEFTPDSASYDGAVHKPSVTVKDANHRVIPVEEYTLTYSATDWKTASSATVKHIVTIADANEAEGNYKITTKTAEFTISMMGQNPLSIVGQPGTIRYGDGFTLSTTGGSGTGTVTWVSSDPAVATIDQNGLVKVLKSGATTITATKAADGNYGAVSVNWSFSAEKKPVTAIVTAKDKEYDTTDTATLVITWKDGDLLSSDTIDLTTVLTGKFDTADAGTGKTVTITGTAPNDDRYAITINWTTTASITPKAATLSGSTPTTLTYNGSEQALVTGVTATSGTLVFSTDGSYYTQLVPTGTNAGTYPVWYKAQGNGNYKDSEAVRLNVTIQPKTVNGPVIELSPDSFEYDGTAKKPDVVVKDGSTVIPAVEYTVSYSNNTAVGTATVTISDNAGGNYAVSGSATFTITAGKATLTAAPQAKVLTYTGASQELVSRGAADNGTVVYSQTETGSYTTTIPRQTNAGNYEVWYKVQNTDGTDATSPQYLPVTIARKTISAQVLLDPEECTYSGDPCTPDVFVLDLDSNDLLDPDADYTVRYMSNTKVGPAKVIVMGKGNYSFSVITTFEIVAAKAKFTTLPTAVTGLTYNGTAQALVNAGTAEGGTPCYSLDGVSYFLAIPTAIDRGSYTVYAKVQGDSTHEDGDVAQVSVTIGVNVLSADQLTVSLSANSFPYTGGEHKPTVTVTDKISGNVISADEYTVTYSSNVNAGTAKVSIKSKRNGNYSFTAEETFTIVAAGQTPLAITGRKDTVYYGDTLSLGTTGGSGDGAVTWSASGPVDTLGDGQYKVKSSGSVTITATKAASGGYGEAKDTWTFYAQPKPVTATVTAANKVYDGNTNATLTVAFNGLLPGESVTSVTAQGQFADADVGTNKTVTITSLTIPDAVSAKYAITHNNTTTASITPAPAAVTAAPTLATGPLTYNGGAQALLADNGTAASGNLMYSLDGKDYSYTVPTGTDAKPYTVWYKVEANDENHKDSAAVKLGSVTISANQDTPTILCTPSTSQYDGTEKTPAVVVRDSAQRIIPESEYTVTFEPGTRIAVGKYKVTVTDKPGGNYQFSAVTKEDAFEIVSASQNPLSIVTDIPTDVHYGDTFRLSAMGGSGSGAIQWSIEGTAAAISTNGVVTVTGTGGFTVKAYRAGADGYSDSNTDSVPFEAKPKPVAPVVTASDKSYDGNTNATLTASWKIGDLVNGDTIALTVSGAFDTADAGSNRRVNITEHTATGENADKYTITWPDSTTASIYKVDAKLATAPAAADLTYTGNPQPLVTAHSTSGDIGTVVYSLNDQNGTYSETIPTGTDAGPYTVWYKVADSVNYTGIAPAAIQVEIKKATPSVNTAPTAAGGSAGDPLSKFSLGGAATDVRGTFAWENPETKAVAGTAYNVIFTPDDTTNYNTVTIQVTPVSAASGGGTGGTNTTPPVETVSSSTQTTIQNGTAKTVLSATDGNRMVQEAVKNQSDRIVIRPEITSDVSKTQVSIPASTVSQIQSETNAALTVASPIADVTIPNGALNTLSQAGGTVNVVTEQVGGAVALTLTADGKTVEDVPGGVTLTVPAEDAGAGTVAVLVHDDGTREVLQRSVVKDGKLSAPLSGSATVEIVDNGKTFADVQPTDWAAEAVTFASARELFNGTSQTTFSPDETTSRGMVATVLYRLEGQPEQALADVYNDVSGDAWYADSVAWAAENGIVNGYGDGQFGPDDSVTREQFVVMLWRYVGSPEANNHDLTAFTDTDQINGYALEALCWAVENGVLNGNGNGRLAPGGTATRAEAAQILKNFIENI